MPIVLELHLTSGDWTGYRRLRQRHIAAGYELPEVALLGQYLRQLDITSAGLTDEEGKLADKLQAYAGFVGSGQVDMIAMDDGVRGRDTLDNAIAAELLCGLGVDPGRLLANVVARNRTADQIRRRLQHFAGLGLRNALLLTGDLPVDPGVSARFPLDSIGMCAVAREMIIDGGLPDDFWICAAGHPNADADPDGLRTLHKALAGAKVIITQAIYSADAFIAWMDALKRQGALDMVHVLAEVIPITSAAQLRGVARVPGIRVPDELTQSLAEHAERIASTARAGEHDADWQARQLKRQGVQVTRTLLHRIRRVPGVSGFYLGCVSDFSAHRELLREAPLLPDAGDGPQKVVQLSGADRQLALAQLPAVTACVDRWHRRARRRAGHPVWRAMRRVVRSRSVDRWLKLMEWPKVPLFGCHHCDRCDLSPDALVCPRGCAKQMSHGPCGAPRLVNGRMVCEDTTRSCTWAAIRRRRDLFGVPIATRLEVRPAPAAGFFRGERFSAVARVLDGTATGPDWSLAWKAPVAWLPRLVGGAWRFRTAGSPRDLATLVASMAHQARAMLDKRPDMDREELLAKVLALVGTPAAHTLIEARLTELHIPAGGTLAELSIRGRFLLAEALPRLRARRAQRRAGAPPGPLERYEALLAVVPEGQPLRRAMRRELASGMVRHIASLGVRVTYRESVLGAKQVDDFLTALTVLKDELQMVRQRLPCPRGGLSARFDRVHYRRHFRAPIAIRRFHDAGGAASDRVELLIDLKQFQAGPIFRERLRASLERLIAGGHESDGAIVLEPFAGESKSLCWSFNHAFWNRLRDFENAMGINYDESIGGSSDRNEAYVRSTARACFDRIHDHDLGGERVYALEIGVASTRRARAFMDELRRMCELTASDVYDRITYVIADYSDAILSAGTRELAADHPNVAAVRIDAADPLRALEPYRGRVIHAHLCNVYDNLPTDKVAWIDGALHRIEARMYLPRATLHELLDKHGLARDDRAGVEARLGALHGDPDGVAALLDYCADRLDARGLDRMAYVAFWMDLFAAFRLEERYVAVRDDGGDLRDVLPDVDRPADVLTRLLSGDRDIRAHVSQDALAGFAQLLKVLHPRGTLEVVDLFVQRIEQYTEAFKGPAKYDGSTVNWINGPLMRCVAEQAGYDVRFSSFKPFDPRSASVILLASPRVGKSAS